MRTKIVFASTLLALVSFQGKASAQTVTPQPYALITLYTSTYQRSVIKLDSLRQNQGWQCDTDINSYHYRISIGISSFLVIQSKSNPNSLGATAVYSGPLSTSHESGMGAFYSDSSSCQLHIALYTNEKALKKVLSSNEG